MTRPDDFDNSPAAKELGVLFESIIGAADPTRRMVLAELAHRRAITLNAPRSVVALFRRLKIDLFAALPVEGSA